MADRQPSLDTPDESGSHPTPDPSGMPRWVKVFGGVVAVLVVSFVVVQVVTGGRHGPGRHMADGHGEASRVAEGAFEIRVRANDLTFDPSEISVRTGQDVAVVLTSVDALHDFTIDELDAHVWAETGEVSKGGFTADRPGRYVFYCSEPGHRQAGMEGMLIVTGGTGGPGGSGGRIRPRGQQMP